MAPTCNVLLHDYEIRRAPVLCFRGGSVVLVSSIGGYAPFSVSE